MFRSIVLGGIALFAVTSASAAADLVTPRSVEAPVLPAAADWSGPYAGVLGGLGASNSTFSIDPAGGGPTLATIDVTGNGWIGGVRAGYDFDASGMVLGVMADLSATNVGAAVSATLGGGGGTLNASSKLDWVGTVQGKLGLPVSDSLLIYAHGGFAYGHTSQTASVSGIGTFTGNQSRSGWTVGAGLQFALSRNLMLNTEYSYTNLGSAPITTIGGVTLSETFAYHAITAGLSYRF